jgi:hypothetical protein
MSQVKLYHCYHYALKNIVNKIKKEAVFICRGY